MRGAYIADTCKESGQQTGRPCAGATWTDGLGRQRNHVAIVAESPSRDGVLDHRSPGRHCRRLWTHELGSVVNADHTGTCRGLPVVQERIGNV